MEKQKKTFLDLVSEEPSMVAEYMESRKSNKEWLKKSLAISVKILKSMSDQQISQKELADRLHVSVQYVSKILKGSENLSLETISKLENALKICLFEIPDAKNPD